MDSSNIKVGDIVKVSNKSSLGLGIILEVNGIQVDVYFKDIGAAEVATIYEIEVITRLDDSKTLFQYKGIPFETKKITAPDGSCEFWVFKANSHEYVASGKDEVTAKNNLKETIDNRLIAGININDL